MVKIFTENTVSAEEVLQNMQTNLIKNASSNEQSESIRFVQALQNLSEAAELFEKSGNYKKANEITTLMSSLVNFNKKNDIKIRNKIEMLDGFVDSLMSNISLKNSFNSHYHNAAINKIASILSLKIQGECLEDKYSEIKNGIYKIKETYSSTPKTLSLISNAANVAKSVLKVVSNENDDWED